MRGPWSCTYFYIGFTIGRHRVVCRRVIRHQFIWTVWSSQAKPPTWLSRMSFFRRFIKKRAQSNSIDSFWRPLYSKKTVLSALAGTLKFTGQIVRRWRVSSGRRWRLSVCGLRIRGLCSSSVPFRIKSSDDAGTPAWVWLQTSARSKLDMYVFSQSVKKSCSNENHGTSASAALVYSITKKRKEKKKRSCCSSKAQQHKDSEAAFVLLILTFLMEMVLFRIKWCKINIIYIFDW